MIMVSNERFDPANALREFTQRCQGAGAIVSFTGHVRPKAPSGPVEVLHLQAYSPMTEQGIEAAILRACKRWPLLGHMVIHRIGDMLPGDPIVFVATACAHRRAAFEAADFLMDYLKTEAVFWKKETGPGGARWIEPRPKDYADMSRWTHTGDH